MCVYSEELLENKGRDVEDHEKENKNNLLEDDNGIRKAVINGTVAHITAIYGFTIAGLIIQEIFNENEI